MNDELKDLLRRAVAHAKTEPKLFNMTTWIRKEPCGTAGCLAYNICLVQGDSAIDLEFIAAGIEGRAVSHLRFAGQKEIPIESLYTYDLFRYSNWPKKCVQMYDNGQELEALEEAVEMWISGNGQGFKKVPPQQRLEKKILEETGKLPTYRENRAKLK